MLFKSHSFRFSILKKETNLNIEKDWCKFLLSFGNLTNKIVPRVRSLSWKSLKCVVSSTNGQSCLQSGVKTESLNGIIRIEIRELGKKFWNLQSAISRL